MSDRSNNDGGETLRHLGHELNNLLAVLLANTEALSRTMKPSDPGRKNLDSIFEALQRSMDVARRISAVANGKDPSQVDPAPAGDGASREALWGKETILLVDDEASLRSVTARFLSMNGYKVLEAGNPERAREIYDQEQESVDVLVTDVMMGEASGLDLARALRQRRPGLKVLFVSGQPFPEGEEGDFLPKPFRPRELLKRLRDILDAGRASTASG